MSKNTQRNQSEINLGNETYHRGYGDGVAGLPKTIKKTHRHAHRYHIGYRHGVDASKRLISVNSPKTMVRVDETGVAQTLFQLPAGKPKGIWAKFKAWLSS